MTTGESASFENIYNTYKSRVYNTVISYVLNTEDAEEVTQDVFVEVYRALGQFRNEAALGTWIYRIAINRSLDFLRRKNRKKRLGFIFNLFDQDQPGTQHSDFVHPGVLLENKERSAILFAAIHRLPENQKTAFILARVEELGNIEVAEIMQLSVGAVESLLSRARENLKKQLATEYKGSYGRRNENK